MEAESGSLRAREWTVFVVVTSFFLLIPLWRWKPTAETSQSTNFTAGTPPLFSVKKLPSLFIRLSRDRNEEDRWNRIWRKSDLEPRTTRPRESATIAYFSKLPKPSNLRFPRHSSEAEADKELVKIIEDMDAEYQAKVEEVERSDWELVNGQQNELKRREEEQRFEYGAKLPLHSRPAKPPLHLKAQKSPLFEFHNETELVRIFERLDAERAAMVERADVLDAELGPVEKTGAVER
ncbi:hypothetical protein C8J56DRAFT_1051569 [Mycena floridula]|nr:hypothetical protein C8J56DRAFT_1051569 [Mycena floridula]